MIEHRLALTTAAVTLVLVVAGGLVHGTGSGLACPDWPTCYGTFFPEMIGGVRFEHTHRVVGALVGLLTGVLAVRLWRARPGERRLRVLGAVAFALVVFQGLLGGLTVILRLPPLVSMSHLAVSMIFFSTIVVLALWTRPGRDRSTAVPERASLAPSPVDSSVIASSAVAFTTVASSPLGVAFSIRRLDIRRAALSSAVAVYLQIVLGAVVRHLGAGLACGASVPLCLGHLWPGSAPGRVHMLHRGFALVVLLAVVVASVRAFRASAERPWPQGGPIVRAPQGGPSVRTLRALSVAGPVLMVVQIGLGVASVVTFLGLPAITLHLAVGALLLASQVALVVESSALESSPSDVARTAPPADRGVAARPIAGVG